MPFDGTAYEWKGQPEWQTPRAVGICSVLGEMALCMLALIIAMGLGAVAGAAVTGDWHPSEIRPGSVIGQIAGKGTFLLVLGGFLWWRIRQLCREEWAQAE